MSTEIKEQLSALMDGEIERDAARFVLRAVETDRALAAGWARFHVTRDCLQRRPILIADAGFAAAVMARLDAESAPVQAGTRWLRYLSGGAVAAAVAVVALIASAPEQEAPRGGTIASGVSTPAPVRATPFNDSILQPRLPQLAQPASATVGGDTLFAPGYDLRSQPSNGWRPVDANGMNLRTPAAPYVLLIVPVQPAEQKTQPRLQ